MTAAHPYFGEFIGTTILLLLGNGVVAGQLLPATKSHGTGWMAITIGWAAAVFVAVFSVAGFSDAHLNPAVTLGLALAGKTEWSLVPGYLLAQLAGAMLGALLVALHYRPHYAIADDADIVLATFATGPALRKPFANLISETIGTFVLVVAVLYVAGPRIGAQEGSLGSLDALPVALVVLAIGLSLGGTTGSAINPARDLGPRIVHALLPLRGKGSSDWGYAWVPVLGPMLGAAVAALLFLAVG